ncbi:MAG: hypothetical protein E7617_00015 [Ruminococcaceae bacterium]|nr:hypothetical protein [Oscillospiraceae bacterium]
MKKKNLIILLLFPFLISVFCIVTINTTYNMVDVDISFIDWDYNDMEAFEISENLYSLRAVGVNQRHYEVSGGSALVWSVKNKDGTDEPYAEVVEKSGSYYLRALRAGEVTVTCSNAKGNVYRSLTAVIYKDAAILMYPTEGSSQSNIDSTVYYGQYDHKRGEAAVIDMTLRALPAGIYGSLYAETSDNVSYDISTGKAYILAPGDAYITVRAKDGVAAPVTYSFNIVEDGVNVYNYDDLLNCTNRSAEGEIVVLRRHFESLENSYVLGSDGKPMVTDGKLLRKANNVECFGYYDTKTGRFSFPDDVYSFRTTYNTEFIEQWNEFAKNNRGYSPVSDSLYVGLHVQKDFYGNGYTINLHNLTYPYSYSTQNGVRIPELTADNLFRGPLKLYCLGDPNNLPLISLYGQDNIGMYVDGDGITVNDVNIKNCDFGDRMANMDTVGTVLEVYGDGITVINSRISNGKNVIRSFSSKDLTVKNCLLSNARNFLFLTGSNKYLPMDKDAVATFEMLDGTQKDMLIGEFIKPDGDADALLNRFLLEYCKNDAERASMRRALEAMQDALNSTGGKTLAYDGSATVEDTYFYRSGISSICMESLFNSPFLEEGSASMFGETLGGMLMAKDSQGKALVPYVAKGVSGIAYPVTVEVKGSTRFYDYKSSEGFDLGGLIEENFSMIANQVIGTTGGIDITVDTIFPLRSMLMSRAGSQGTVYRDPESGNSYINATVAYYGGGANLSVVKFDLDDEESNIGGTLSVGLLDSYLNMPEPEKDDIISDIKGPVLKTVIAVTGFEPFRFNLVKNGYLFGESPNVQDLIANAKEYEK